MALSQKHSGKIMVPWYNSHEWRYVYSLIYSENSTKSDKQKALTILEIWKTRMPILFAGVEGTLIILNAMLYDENEFTKEQVNSLYALAIMRFLNLCAAQSDQQGTFFQIAKERNLPEWLVNIRHDLAHSQKQSSLFMLQKGIYFCFEWLKHEYWEAQEAEVSDFIIPAITEDMKERIHLYCKYVNAIIKENSSSSAVNILKRLNITKYSKSSDIIKNILGGNKLAMEATINLVVDNYLFLIATDEIEAIPISYIKGWEPLMQYLQKNNALLNMIRKLHDVCINNEDHTIQKTSSLWLKEIFQGLAGKKNLENGLENTESDVYIMNFCDLSEKFLFELKEFVNEAFHTPHLHFKNYSASSMMLCAYNISLIQDIDRLLFEFHNLHSKPIPGYIPITIEHAKAMTGINAVQEVKVFEKLEPICSKKWQKILDTDCYEGCPIGILPYQNRDCNPIITF